MSKFAAVLGIVCLMATGIAAGGQSKLETDYDNQMGNVRIFGAPTDEASCGGTYLKVSMLGKEIRHMEWNIETSQRIISREIYFSRGKPQLVIESSFPKFDKSGKAITNSRIEYTRRYWLHDRSAGRTGTKLRHDLRKHAENLVRYFSAHRAEFTN